jgi:Ca2+-binding RTX toxin-like protein
MTAYSVNNTPDTELSTTGTGLDRLVGMIVSNRRLNEKISADDIAAGARAADGMNQIIHQAIVETGSATDGVITTTDIIAINGYIREHFLEEWTLLHGDDENGEETGFHLVQNDGAGGRMFGKNIVNKVADGIYHLGFEIEGGNILNEDGNNNATLSDLADWLNFFYLAEGDTGTGLDVLIEAIKNDRGLLRNTTADDVNGGIEAANQLNHIVADAIEATAVAADGLITVEDVIAINGYIRTNNLDQWTALHGDDENGEETGFHLIQNDGGNTRYHGDKLVDTVIDGLYHLGFEISGENVLNEDGDANATLADLATWLNKFYLAEDSIFGTDQSEVIRGHRDLDESFWARGGDDKVIGRNGNDYINGGEGSDHLKGNRGNDQLVGEEGNDLLKGNAGDDLLQGGEGNDKLWGGVGEDILEGGLGEDTIKGGAGDDLLYSVADGANDQLKGGAGADTFYFEAVGAGIGQDTIKHFSASQGDSLVISGDNAAYELTAITNNRHLVELYDQQEASMGSVLVIGEFSAADISFDASAFLWMV